MTQNYLVAEPNDPVSTTPSAANSTMYRLLWGSVDVYNTFTLNLLNGSTLVDTLSISGSQVAAAGGFAADGSNAAYVTITDLPGFNQVVETSSGPAFEFDPAVVTPTAVPEPTSLVLLGSGLLGLGLLSRRFRKR